MLFTGECRSFLEEELLTYHIFAIAYGWSPKDIEDLEWKKVVYLRHIALKYLEEKNKSMAEMFQSLFSEF